jgi:hypothetical protein
MNKPSFIFLIAAVAAVILLLTVMYSKEGYISMPAAYITPSVKLQAMEGGGQQLYMKATRIPENWSGFLENSDGAVYKGLCPNPYQTVHATGLVEAIVDKENKFHCYYNTNARGMKGHLMTQLPKDRKCSLNRVGDGIVCMGPGKASGLVSSNMLQPPWSYNPADHMAEVTCPNYTSFQFSCVA